MSDKNAVIQEQHRCTACGGELRFDPETQTLMCGVCDESREPEVSEGVEATGCPNCGAELTVITGSRQAKCDSCDSTFQMLQDGEDCEIVGDIPDNHKYIAAFSASREDYQKSMITWLANEKGTPVDAFDKIAMIRSAEGIYVPHYYCVVSYNVHWTASIGHDRVETYIVHVPQRDSRGNTRMVPMTRTRIVTDWHPHSANAAGRVTLSMQASGYLSQVSEKVHSANSQGSLAGIRDSSHGRAESAGSIEADSNFRNMTFPGGQASLQPLDAKFTAGFRMLPCEVSADKVYDKQVVHNMIAAQIERNAPGDRIRNLSFNGAIIPDYFLIYRPYWSTVYTYDKKVCAGYADGTNATKHYGTRPIDKGQKKRAFQLMIPCIVAGAIALIAFVNAAFADPGNADRMFDILMVFVWLTIISGAGGLIARSVLFSKSKKALKEQKGGHLGNTSTIFSRKSGAADPTAGI